MSRISLLTAILLSPALIADEASWNKNEWPAGTRRVEIRSSRDQSKQPALLLAAKGSGQRPLLVGLHTWSGDYSQAGGETVYARWCQERNWHFIHPHFRGPNRSPQALGSDFAVQDILDAVAFMQSEFPVDQDRIYLVGVSGGGHMALLMAARHPETWAGVSAWCPISDVEAWWKFHAFRGDHYRPGQYARDIEQALGGRPDSNATRRADCWRRSSLGSLSKAQGVPIDINHGIQDGRKGSVPFTHSIWAFNELVKPADRVLPDQWRNYYESQQLPEGMGSAEADGLYGSCQPLFRRSSANARVTIFEGGHEIVHVAALNWLAHQRRNRPAVWKLSEIHPLATSGQENQASR